MFRRRPAFAGKALESCSIRSADQGGLGRLSLVLALTLILAVAAALRLYGVAWDGGLWLQPDERQIYFVTNSLGWPQTLSQAFSAASPLNPHFFAYGSLPIYLLKLIAVLLAPLVPVLRDPGNLHLIGRPATALLDVGTVAMTFRLARTLAGERGAPKGADERDLGGSRGSSVGDIRPSGRGALLAAALVSLAVLPIQASHFFTADVLLTFLAVLSLNLAADLVQGAGRRHQAALGVAVGLALATKLTAAPLLLLIPAAYWLRTLQPQTGQADHPLSPPPRRGPWSAAAMLPPFPSPPPSQPGWLRGGLLVLAIAAITFFLVEPYAAIDWHTFLADTLRESQIAWGRLDVPYTRQYAGTLPYLYSIWQTALWGLGLPLGLLGWAGFATTLIRWLRRGAWADTLLIAWAGPYLAIAGLLHARPLRYVLPLVPVLCIVAARLAADGRWREEGVRGRSCVVARRWMVAGRGFLLLLTLAYALAFASIYTAPHSWIEASQWIYHHVPAGSSLAVEEWDTPLPLPIEVDGRAHRIEEYRLHTLALYAEPDGVAKWSQVAPDLADSDYLVIASRRLYGSIPRLPERYPVTSRYYTLLFTGKLGFQLEGEFTRGPAWLNPRFQPLPGAAPAFLQPDESFVVYDHPRVLLFRNADHLPAEELLRRLLVAEE